MLTSGAGLSMVLEPSAPMAGRRFQTQASSSPNSAARCSMAPLLRQMAAGAEEDRAPALPVEGGLGTRDPGGDLSLGAEAVPATPVSDRRRRALAETRSTSSPVSSPALRLTSLCPTWSLFKYSGPTARWT